MGYRPSLWHLGHWWSLIHPHQSPLIALTVLATWPGFNVLCTHNTAWPMVNAPSCLVHMILCLQNSATFSFPTQDRIRKSRGKAIKVNELPSSPFQAGMQRKHARFPQAHLLSQPWLVILQNIDIALIQLQCMLFTYSKWNRTPFRFNFETCPNSPLFKCPLTKFNAILPAHWGSATSHESSGFYRWWNSQF